MLWDVGCIFSSRKQFEYGISRRGSQIRLCIYIHSADQIGIKFFKLDTLSASSPLTLSLSSYANSHIRVGQGREHRETCPAKPLNSFTSGMFPFSSVSYWMNVGGMTFGPGMIATARPYPFRLEPQSWVERQRICLFPPNDAFPTRPLRLDTDR